MKADLDELLRRAAAGDQESLGALLLAHKDRLRALVAFRLNPLLQGRVDPSDVIQEVFLTVSLHLTWPKSRPPRN